MYASRKTFLRFFFSPLANFLVYSEVIVVVNNEKGLTLHFDWQSLIFCSYIFL